MATTVTPSFTGSVASFIQGVNVDNYSRFGRAIAPLLGRASKNNYYLSSSTGTVSLDNTQTFFDDSRKGPALMTSGTVGTVRVAITDQKQRVIVTPSYFVEQREFGYDQYFTATEPVLSGGLETGKLKFAPFKEMGKWNSVHYIESPETMQWPVVLDSPSALDPFEFNGVIEPLTIRKKITESSTFLDTPEDPEPHSIRGCVTSGEMLEGGLKKVFPASNFYNPKDTSLGISPWENLGDAITYDSIQDHVLPMPIVGDVPPSSDPFGEKNEVDDFVSELKDRSIFYYLTGSSEVPYRLGQTWSSTNNAVDGTIYSQDSVESLQAWWRLDTDLSSSVDDTGSYGIAPDSFIYNRSGSIERESFLTTLSSTRPSAAISEGSNFFNGSIETTTARRDSPRISIGSTTTWNAIIGNDSGNGGTSQMTLAGWYNIPSGSAISTTRNFTLFAFADAGPLDSTSNAGGIELYIFSQLNLLGQFSYNRLAFRTRWSGDPTAVSSVASSEDYTAAGGDQKFFDEIVAGDHPTFAENREIEDVWIHFAVTYDATDYRNAPKFYINGQLLGYNTNSFASTTSSETWGGISNAGYGHDLGCNIGCQSRNRAYADPQDPFTGYLCDLAVWNRPLTADQIYSLYRAKSNTLYKVKQETLRSTVEGRPSLDSKSASVGFTYDNNPIGIDSIAFGGLKK